MCTNKFKNSLLITKFFFLIILIFPTLAWGYIDPGTSGFAFSFLGPLIAAGLGFLAIFFRPIFNLLRRMFGKFKKPHFLVALGVILTIGVIIFGFAKKGNVSMKQRVIVLGMDGLDPRIMERLMDEGQLPNFARLRQSGTYAHLQSSNPSQSPVAWSCMATGVNPGKHGIFDFIRRDPKTYLPDLAILKFNKNKAFGDMFSPVRQGLAFWEISAQKGVPSTVIRWPISFPPKKDKATVFSGLGTPDIKGTLGHYAFYTNSPFDTDTRGNFKLNQIAVVNGVINTQISGPPVSGLTGQKDSTLPMTIRLDEKNKQVTIEVDGQTLTIKEKSWSDWAHFKFKLGFMKNAAAIGKFYLAQISPFKLYLSPLQADPKNPAFELSNPSSYVNELAEKIGDYHTLGMPEDTNALSEGRLDEPAFLESCSEITLEREKMLRYELTRFKGGLLAIVFDTSDRIQHMFWRNQEQEGRYSGVIDGMYKHMDKILGIALGYVDDNTLLIVCSDHGFTSFKRAAHLNSWLAEQGYLKLKSAPDERENNSLFNDVIWEESKAYALGFGAIYLNLKGREGKGIVASNEAKQLAQEIADKLRQWKDPENDAPVVKGAYLKEEIYSGPYVPQAPDIVVGFYPGYRASWQTAVGGAPNRLLEDNLKLWSGDHCVDPQFVPGVLFSNAKLKSANPRLIDIAPTVLDGLGLTVPSDMEGESLRME